MASSDAVNAAQFKILENLTICAQSKVVYTVENTGE